MKLNVRTDDIPFGTNILKVKVPKQLRNKVKSGLDYIDCALGGEGFTPSAVTFFTGTPGSGKTTMILKMADSLTKQGANPSNGHRGAGGRSHARRRRRGRKTWRARWSVL